MLKKISLILMLSVLSLFAAQSSQKMFQTVSKEKATLVKSGSDKMFCNVCGMHLTKFYKTSHAVEFKNGHKEQYCSMHCLSEVKRDHGEKIKAFHVVDTNSLKLIDATKAFYVVGSSKKGTMTMTSKYAFKTEAEAKAFQSKFGGEIKSFDDTLALATKGLSKDYKMIGKKRAKMAKMGKKIYSKMCKQDALPDFNSIGETKKYLIENKVCKKMKPKMLQAVSIYRFNPALATDNSKKLEVSKDAKCPVCGMFVSKFPKWAAMIKVDEKHTHYFDGVKDLMKFYFNPSKFSHNHKQNEMNNIQVTDYYSLEAIDGKKAFYVIGSNIYGPMGEELIPFKSEDEAKIFMKNHYGKKVLKFEEIKEAMLY